MTEAKAKSTITIVFGILLTCLTLLNGWQMFVIGGQNRQIAEQNKQIAKQNEKFDGQIRLQNQKFDALPEKYVRLERYASDTQNIKATINQVRDSLGLDIRSLSIDIKDLGKKIDIQFSLDRNVEK